AEPPQHARAGGGAERVRDLRAPVAARVAIEAGEERVRPAAAVELLYPAGHQLQAAAALVRLELEPLYEARQDVLGVPGVDEQRARQHVRGAGELAQDERPPPAVA